MIPPLSEPTGYPELDRLLGIGRPLDHAAKLLIRGGPGAGKTTLALQILALQLRESREGLTMCHKFGLYISLEQPPHAVLKYNSESFGETMSELAVHDRATDDWKSGELVTVDRAKFLERWGEAEETLAQDLREGKSMSLLNAGVATELMKTGSAAIADYLPEIRSEDRADAEVWVVVDSINLLEHLLQVNFARKSNRSEIDAFCEELCLMIRTRRSGGNSGGDNVRVIFVFTSEHHSGENENFASVAESFLCDIEIVLTPEPITGFAHAPSRNLPPNGYNVEVHQAPSKKEKAGFMRTVVETRPFCRVLKCRFGKNQSRRCSYSIVPGLGISFNEVYPGDGHLLVFAENERQWIDWEDFLHRDAPYEYPALRYEIFDRSGLQRVFATQRRIANKPTSTDLSIATFDTYWIRWNIEMHRRFLLTGMLKEKLKLESLAIETTKAFNNFTCDFDWSYTIFSKLQEQGERDDSLKHHLTLQLENVLARLLKGSDGAGFREVDEPTIRLWLEEAMRVLGHSHGMFQTLPPGRLRLFGRKCSPFIHELSIRDELRSPLPPVSLPYHTNVSFLVSRTDLLEKIPEDHAREIAVAAREMVANNQKRVSEFAERILPQVKRLWPYNWDDYHYSPGEVDSSELNSIALPFNPSGWEQIICTCKREEWHLLAETRTFDTYICFFLEIFWGCGGTLELNEAYDLSNPGETAVHLFQALVLLRSLFDRGVLPQGSTLEPKTFGRKYSAACPAQEGPLKWAFARHWYSTFVDTLTARDNEGFYWKDGSAVLDIHPMPWSSQTVSRAKMHRDGTRLEGVSCWGEWHLAVLKGSENIELALDVLNNLMSSQKISDRALGSAGLPTVEEFYHLYKDTPVLRMPERTEVKSLPKVTYAQLRASLFRCARSRTAMFDFRHCMREIHGLLESIENNPKVSSSDLGDMLLEALTRIRMLRDRELLLR